MLRAEGIVKQFRQKAGGAVRALDGVSLAVPPGGMTALLGPDGAGKTTLLRIIAGLLRADAGQLAFAGGQPAAAMPQAAQAHIGYMPQKFGLYEDLSVQENLDLYADLKGVPHDARAARYRELLDMCALAPFTKRLAGQLSGGMKQKLGLICTLVAPPKLLLLDEPTVGVDPLSRRELWDIVTRLTAGSGMAVIVSTSYLDEAARCGEAVLLHEGRTLARGAPGEICQRSAGMAHIAQPAAGEAARALWARLFAAPGMVDAVPQAGAVRFVHGALDAAQQRQLARALRGAAVRSAPPALEDSFMLLLRKHQEYAYDSLQDKQAVEDDNNWYQDAESAHSAPHPLTPAPLPLSAACAAAGARGDGHARAGVEEVVFDGYIYSHQQGKPATEDKNDEYAAREPIIQTQHVSRYFGSFAAVDDVSFAVYPGEVFGLLGPNGAGKTTTFRMLCGLLPASSGQLVVAGVDVRRARAKAREHLGYVAQKFSLYGQLSVRENLEFFAAAYGLRGARLRARTDAVVHEFGLQERLGQAAGSLPGGWRQRLAMAVGLLHEPAILFLDEATSGADPLARREFWQRIARLAAAGVTVVVTTHFMEEAEYCDRILIQDAGRMLALGRPADIRAQAAGALAMEDAFIAIVEQARAAREGRA